MGLRHGILILLLGFSGQVSGPALADAHEFQCADAKVTVTAERAGEAELACDVAAEADARLRSLGLAVQEPVRIEITETLDAAPGSCVALYNTADKTLQVLPVDCLKDRPGRASAFPEMDAELLFESLILHELVHAYTDQSAEGRILPRVAYEYLAYAIQLDALPKTERARILAKVEVATLGGIGQINDAVLALSPLRFAALSWLHFSQEGGDADLVRRILRGELRFNSLKE